MLLDHFHSPLKDVRPWTGLHSMWAGKLASAISRRLPDGWFAAPTVQWGIEVDVAAFEQTPRVQTAARADHALVIPEPTRTIDFALTTDIVEVRVYRDVGELTLVGAIELVSPSNKDRPESREAFVSKCDALLREGIGLVIVDVVTSRHANLHAELMERLGEPPGDEADLYIASYRPLGDESAATLSIWYRPLEIGGEFPPTLLFLKGGPIVELPLEETCYETCSDLKIILRGNP